MVFADADFFIGLFYQNDSHHQKCKAIFEQFRDGDFCTSWDVVDEVVTKLTYFGKKEIAQRFLERTIKDEVIVIYPDCNFVLKASEYFKKQTIKHVSLTDCMNMAIAFERKIDTFLSFDEVYKKNGFRLMK